MTASPSRGALVFRGEPLSERLFCGEKPPVHTFAGRNCPGRHVQFHPIRFGFEHFDEVGRYRSTENKGVPAVAAARVSRQLTTWYFGGAWVNLREARRADSESGAIGFIEYLSSLAGEPRFIERTAP